MTSLMPKPASHVCARGNLSTKYGLPKPMHTTGLPLEKTLSTSAA